MNLKTEDIQELPAAKTSKNFNSSSPDKNDKTFDSD